MGWPMSRGQVAGRGAMAPSCISALRVAMKPAAPSSRPVERSCSRSCSEVSVRQGGLAGTGPAVRAVRGTPRPRRLLFAGNVIIRAVARMAQRPGGDHEDGPTSRSGDGSVHPGRMHGGGDPRGTQRKRAGPVEFWRPTVQASRSRLLGSHRHSFVTHQTVRRRSRRGGPAHHFDAAGPHSGRNCATSPLRQDRPSRPCGTGGEPDRAAGLGGPRLHRLGHPHDCVDHQTAHSSLPGTARALRSMAGLSRWILPRQGRLRALAGSQRQ